MNELSPSQIENLLSLIQSLRYLFDYEPSDSTADKLNQFENKFTLDELEYCLVKKSDEELSSRICKVLAHRWERIRSTCMSYTEKPSNLVNQFCLDIASALYPIPKTETEIDELPEGKGPYFILMPSLKASADVAGTNIHNLLLQQFIISDNDEVYIPIESILERAATSDEGEFQHYVSADGNFPKLSADELKRLKNHSSIIKDYIYAIEQFNDLRIRGEGLGPQLLRLVNSLRAGGSHHGQNHEEARRLGLNPDMNAGSKANIGITEFAEYWDKVPGDTKSEYFRKYPELEDMLGRIFRPTDAKYRNTILCVELIADAIETIITSNRLSIQSLEQFERAVAAKKAIVLREIKSDQYAFLPSLAKSPRIYADIFKLPIDEQKLCLPGYENLCMYLLAKDPLALIELKDLITEDIRQEICTKKYNGNNTPLMAAVNSGSTQLVNLLLEMGVNIDDVDSSGDTALMHAVRANSKDVVISLLEKGARIDIANSEGLNPLTLAEEMGHQEIIEIILLKALSLSKATQLNILPLHYDSVLAYVLEEHLQFLPLILGKIIELKDKDILYRTYKFKPNNIIARSAILPREFITVNALMLAAFYNELDLMQKLVDDLGADIDDIPSPLDNYTALMFAAQFGKIDAVNKLLSMGAYIESQSKEKDTALSLAVKYGYREIVEVLLEKGASLLPRHIDYQYNSLDYAFYALMHAPEIVDMLLLKAMSLDADDQEELLSNVNGVAYKSVFDYILNKRRHLIVHFLEDAISKNNRTILDAKVQDYRLSMLMVAIEHGNNHLVCRLIDESHLNIDESDIDGDTALIYAVHHKKMDIVTSLLSRNANLELKNDEGNTALLQALKSSYKDAFEAILEKNPNLTTRNNLHQNVLDIALSISPYGNGDFVDKILLQAAFLSLEDQQNLLSGINGGEYKSILSYVAANREITLIAIINKALDLNLHDILGQKIKLGATFEMHLIPYIMRNFNIISLSLLSCNLILRFIDTGVVALDNQDNNGNTMLHYAVEFARKDILSKLLERNANIELKSSLGDTVLISAVKFNNLDLFDALIAKKPKLTTRDNDLKNVLDLAHEQRNHKFIEPILLYAATLSLAEQTELLSKINNGRHKTVLSYAASFKPYLVENLLNITIALKKQDVLDEKISSSPTMELSLLPYIIEFMNESDAASLLSRLIDAGMVDINQQDISDGNTILHKAIEFGKTDIVLSLLSKNANLELKSSTGNNALLLAVKEERLAIFNSILAKNPSLITRDNDLKNVLDLAHEQPNHKFIEPILLHAATLSLAEQTELLSKIDNGRHKTVLSYAASFKPSLVENLLNITIALKKQDVLDEKISLSPTMELSLLPYLMQNMRFLTFFIVTKLIKEHLIDINQKDTNGKTILQLAIDANYRSMIVILIENHADLEIPDNDNNTALYHAINKKNDIFSTLLTYGANLTARNRFGDNALDLAFKNFFAVDDILLAGARSLEPSMQRELLARHGAFNDVLSYALLKKPHLVMPILRQQHQPTSMRGYLVTNRLETYIKRTKLLEHIEIIKAKWQEMEAKARVNPRYIEAAKAAEKLTKDLINETSLLIQMDSSAAGYDKKITKFQTNCLSHIEKAKTVLDVHRCDLWKKILGALILALTAPISLPMRALGFFSIKTDSAKKLDSFTKDLSPAMVV